MDSLTLSPNTTALTRLEKSITDFFTRNGFDSHIRTQCDALAQSLFPDSTVSPVPRQGYCSYTVSTTNGHIVQFRPARYELDVGVSTQAGDIFESLAPRTLHSATLTFESEHACDDETKKIYVYCQRRITGLTLSEFRCIKGHEKDDARRCRRALVEDLASLFATSCRRGKQYTQGSGGSFAKGHVGSSLGSRLQILRDLPDAKIRETVGQLQQSINALQCDAKWCLTHGDLVPANIMVCPVTGHLTGLIDWAEGEWLPFGVGLYGLEEVLGEEVDGGFQYYPDHIELRDLFWRRFTQEADLRLGEFLGSQWVTDLGACRRLGILLWRGLAFDDGRIDRVVDEKRDATELCKLRAFLAAPEPCSSLGFWTRVGLAMKHAWKSTISAPKIHGLTSQPHRGSWIVVSKWRLQQQDNEGSMG